MASEERTAERIPPQAVDVERAVLGAMLIEREAGPKSIEVLEEDYFYRDAHRKIFSAIVALFDRSEPADSQTIVEELRKRKELDAIGGASYLAELATEVATAANVEYHAKIVSEKALLRKMITLSTQIATECYEASQGVDDLIDQAEQRIFNLSSKRLSKGFEPLSAVLHDTFETIEQSHQREGMVSGVSTGYDELDEMTSGLQPSELVIVAGRPSMGKTAFALCVARNAAIEHKVPVGIFSLEMANHQLAQRLLCAEARVDAHRLRIGRLPDEAWAHLSHSVGKLAEAPIFIDDSPSLSAMEIRAKSRRLQSEHGIGMIIVDYLQLMRGSGRVENRQQEISQISRALKALAKELNVPVIAVSQLSRAVETRGGDRRPMLSDLRESGAIEQDADVVMFIYREERYNPDTEQKGIAEVIIGKQRNGPIGTVKLTWINEYARFENPVFRKEEPF